MKTDMVPQNVAMKVDRPRKNSFQPTFLDAEQMQKLFEVVKGTRLELPVLVAAFYGLRRGEVLGLKWDAIDFNRGTLTIKRTVTEATIDGTMKIIEQDSAKTKSSLRTLELTGLFWRRGWDSNPCAIARKLISSVVRLWQIHLWIRSFQAAL